MFKKLFLHRIKLHLPTIVIVTVITATISACDQNESQPSVVTKSNNDSSLVVSLSPKEIIAVRKTIDQLFDGMRKADSSLVRSAFHVDPTMQSCYTNKKGERIVKTESIEDFINAVGSPHAEIWDERTYNIEINVDGPMAQAWVPYQFYIDSTFSHCGVNAFQLIKPDSLSPWKIIRIMDTRRRKDCLETTNI